MFSYFYVLILHIIMAEYKLQIVDINSIKLNKDNPRLIKDEKFKKLVNSIIEFPEMLKIRPIVVNGDMMVLGGNMRLRACKEVGLVKIPVVIADNLTEEQQREFLIKDNVGFGEWNFDDLANNWEINKLVEWGMDLPSNWGEDVDETTDEDSEVEATKLLVESTDVIELTELFSELSARGLKCSLK